MDIAKALTFQFEDPEWLVKILVGALLLLLGLLLAPIIVGLAFLFVLTGYMVDVVRNVMAGKEHPMPRWENWGEWFSSGLKFFIIQLVWAIPSILFWIFGEAGQLLAKSTSSGIAAFGLLAVIIFGLLNLAWGVILALVMPALMVNYAKKGEVSAGLDFSFILDFVQKEIVNIVIAAVILLVAVLVGSIAGLVLCIIGVFPAMFWVEMVEAHLYGQIGRDYFGKLEPETPVESPQT